MCKHSLPYSLCKGSNCFFQFLSKFVFLQVLESNNDDSEIHSSLPKDESFHYCGMPLRRVGSRDAAFIHTQDSDDFFRHKLLVPQFMVEDVTNEENADSLLSATIVPHVQSESDDDHKSYTREEENKNANEVQTRPLFSYVLLY